MGTTDVLITWVAPNWATPNHTKYGITITTAKGTVLFNITTSTSKTVTLPSGSAFHIEVYALDDNNNKSKVISKDFTTSN